MAQPLSPDETFILSIWAEVLMYGLYLGLFCSSVYVVIQKRNFHTVPSRVMFGSMFVMFFLATFHVAMNLYRLLRGYVWLRDAPGGPAAYFSDLAKWDHVLKDTIFATQSLIGDSLSIYRCWIIWDKNYYIIALPLVLVTCNTFSGYIVAWLYTQVSADTSTFTTRLDGWIKTFYSICFVQNVITTSLISYHIWRHDHTISKLNIGSSSLMPIARIVIESAAIYVAAELVAVTMYGLNITAYFIVFEMITPIVGIVFTSITVRLALRSQNRQNLTSSMGVVGTGESINLPMHPLAVHITRTFHNDIEGEGGKISEDPETLTENK